MRHRLIILLAVLLIYACKDDVPETTPSVELSSAKTLDELNANVRAFQTLLAAQQEGKTVKTCTQVSNAAFQVTLDDGTSVTVLLVITALGESEAAAYAPVVSAMKNGETYYWTVDGEFLLAGSDKQPAIGGSAPILGVDADNYWTITCGGVTQRLNRKVESGLVKSIFAEVIQSIETEVKFSLRGNISYITLSMNGTGDGSVTPPPPATGALRRPISPSQPAWLVHIDTWNYADPQKIIDLIPADIRPFAIFNISLSINHDEVTGRFLVSEYGYEVAKSWLRTCAENQVWAIVQPSSGGFCHFPDVSAYSQLENSVYEEFYRDYPNFLGFNYCEQFWGYDDKFSVSWLQRVAHWTHLLKMSNLYGGYLVVSFCGNQWSPNIDPIALVKRNPDFAQAARQYTENFILCEKYTTQGGFFNVESMCLGTYLSGFSGNYGIRFDQCGWTEETGQNGDIDFPPAAGALPVIEHVMLTGQTVIDGPELIWVQCFREGGTVNVGDGYSSRSWNCFPQFVNINIDMFRKILDGTIRIPTRREVIDRSKYVILQDVNSGSDDARYSAPANLYEGLYLRDDDGNLWNNRCYFKKTGRYPTVPVAVELNDAVAKSFAYQINQSNFDALWGDVKFKTGKFNSVFPEEYSGELYAGRLENGWVIYNGLAGVRTADVPFKYNTCGGMNLAFDKYTVAVVKEFASQVSFYINNYGEGKPNKTDVIKIYGCTSAPTHSFTPRAEGTGTVSASFADGVYTLTVSHNGPLDLVVNCSGDATGRATDYTAASITAPASPPVYYGARQYEAECFDFKNVASRITKGDNQPVRNYTGQGYIIFGANAAAAVRDAISVVESGTYSLRIRYRSPSATVNNIDLYVNGVKTANVNFPETDNDISVWNTVSISTQLQSGTNTFELKTTSAASAPDLHIDNLVIEKQQ
jgi:hypothetical protein